MPQQEKLSPMMQQYLQMKEQYPGTLLFFRLGDFYEMFFEDAKLVSRLLELTLTGKECGLAERAPMCGVPYHAVDTYASRLLEMGYKVAICEQMEDPALAKGLVSRDVIRILTPGTLVEADLLDEKSNNFLLTLYLDGTHGGFAYADISTGQWETGSMILGEDPQPLLDELVRLSPREVLVNPAMADYFVRHDNLAKVMAYPPQTLPEDRFAENGLCQRFDLAGLTPSALCAAYGLLSYLSETQKNALTQMQQPKAARMAEEMLLDAATRRNLELTETLRGKGRKGSLLWILDHTATAMGGRLLRQWIDRPLLSVPAIRARLDAVEALSCDSLAADSLNQALSGIHDMERIATRVCYESLNGRDCQSLGESLTVLPRVKEALLGYSASMLQGLGQELDTLDDLSELLARAISDHPPISVKEGGIIREGYNEQLDLLRHAAGHGREMIARMEAKEKEETGIRNLKISYNRVFGYYIEVSASNLPMVPYRYSRKQTLTNAERFITPELKELEETILGAEEKSVRLEYELFTRIREEMKARIRRIQSAANVVAQADCLLSLALTAQERHYVKPAINEEGRLDIVDGRHPVVEAALQGARFVANNTLMDMADNRFIILTGPNMGGKSTYLRQVALITLMAHMGGFVPAARADIPLTDRIFTRIGAADDLFMGQSTFMVEMAEVANILTHATRNSLVILDEVGRGTSTYDGLSIAWAVVEYLCNRERIGAKTLFATHYHELTGLEGQVAGVKNACVAAREVAGEVVFLHRIVKGGADKSFGVHVAKLAGLPEAVLARSNEILGRLEAAKLQDAAIASSTREAAQRLNTPSDEKREQLDMTALLPYGDILQEIRQADINQMTPIDAFYLLGRLKEKM